MQLNTFFTGNKIVGAIPMTHDTFCNYVGRDIDPAELDVTGYLVEYLDGGKTNHPGHVGYISWSPSEVFEKNYLSIGDITGLAPHVIRLKAERAENYDRLQKLTAFLDAQADKRADPESLPEGRAAAIADLPLVSDEQLQLQREQQNLMFRLEHVLSARLAEQAPSIFVDHAVTLRFSIANGTHFDIMSKVFAALGDKLDPCYTGTIHAIEPTSVKVFDPQGQEIKSARARTEKLVRGFSISGDINESENLFDVAIDSQRGTTQIVSSFEEEYQLELVVQLADSNRRRA